MTHDQTPRTNLADLLSLPRPRAWGDGVDDAHGAAPGSGPSPCNGRGAARGERAAGAVADGRGDRADHQPGNLASLFRIFADVPRRARLHADVHRAEVGRRVGSFAAAQAGIALHPAPLSDRSE